MGSWHCQCAQMSCFLHLSCSDTHKNTRTHYAHTHLYASLFRDVHTQTHGLCTLSWLQGLMALQYRWHCHSCIAIYNSQCMNEYAGPFFSMALSMCGAKRQWMFLLMLLTKVIWIGHIGWARKERHTSAQKSDTDMDTHKLTKVSIHSLSGLRGLTYLPLIQKCMRAMEGWFTPQQPLLPFNIHQRVRLGQLTSLTFIGPSDSIVHRIVITYIGLTTECVGVYVGGWEHTKCNLSHRCTPSMPLALYLQAASTDLKLCKVKMSPRSQRHTPAVYVFQIYMHIRSDPGDNENIFTCVLFCSGKSSYKTTAKFLWAQQGIKESFNKISGEFSWLIVCSCFAITEHDTPSAITISPLWRVEGWDCSVHTPAGCHSEQDPWSCLDSLTVWPHHLTKSKQPTGTLLQTPPPTSPVSPWRSTMQKNHLPQPHINIHMKVWRSLNRTVISLNIRLTESSA